MGRCLDQRKYPFRFSALPPIPRRLFIQWSLLVSSHVAIPRKQAPTRRRSRGLLQAQPLRHHPFYRLQLSGHPHPRPSRSLRLPNRRRALPHSPLSQTPRTGLSRPLNTTTSAPTSLRTKTGSGPSTTSSSTSLSQSQPSPSASTWPIISRPEEEEAEEEEEDSAPLLPYPAPA